MIITFKLRSKEEYFELVDELIFQCARFEADLENLSVIIDVEEKESSEEESETKE